MIKYLKIKFLVALLVFLTTVVNSSASEPAFTFAGLRAVYELLPTKMQTQFNEKDIVPSGVYFLDAGSLIKDKQIVFRINQYKEVSHIGLQLFSGLTTNTNEQVVFDYLERKLLFILLSNSSSDILNLMDQENLAFYVNNRVVNDDLKRSIQTHFSSISNASFTLYNTQDSFSAKWSIGPLNYIEFRFPNNFITISGMDKYELEQHLMSELQNLPEGRAMVIDLPKSDLTPYKDEMFVLRGGTYKNVDDISADYFLLFSNQVKPVYDDRFILESASNLFLNIVPSNIRLNINHKQYGDKHQSCLVNINDFLSFFRDDYSLYFGWQNKDLNNLKASVFIYNSYFDYSHTLIISFQHADIFVDQRVLQTEFYSYTPHNNLKQH